MPTTGIPFSPYSTTTAGGTFNIDSTGYVQGCALDAPHVRNSLVGGWLNTTDTLPMWGGVGITELVPFPQSQVAVGSTAPLVPIASMGNPVGRATTLTALATGQLTGFSVFDQNYAMVNTPGSPVGLIGTYGRVHYYRLGSGARIPVAIDPSLVSLEGGLTTQQVSWDFNAQALAPYNSTATYAITSETWSAANGGQVAVVASVPTPVGAVGDQINISGATNAGSAGNSAVNGEFTVTAFTDNQHFVIALPASAGQIGAIGGTILANYSIGALNVRILDVNIGQSMTVNYNAQMNSASWNRTGSTAIILI